MCPPMIQSSNPLEIRICTPICPSRISYKCMGCQNYIGDEFNDKLLVRKDLVLEVITEDEADPEKAEMNNRFSEMQAQIRELQGNVEFLKYEQKEIKKAMLGMKDNFENQLVDIKRGILHLANEFQKIQ